MIPEATFYPVASEAEGLQLSAQLWSLVRPVRQAKDTERLCAVVQDAAGKYWMELPDSHAELPIAEVLTEEILNSAVDPIEKAEDAL